MLRCGTRSTPLLHHAKSLRSCLRAGLAGGASRRRCELVAASAARPSVGPVTPASGPAPGPPPASAPVAPAWRTAMEAGGPLPRVLSVQSHVVHGYVGNKCAVFPLQVLGLEVDPVHSVQFSNHTGYPSFAGDRFNGEQLRALAAGLEANGLLTHTHLLTGYIGSLSLLQAIADLCAMLRRHSPHLTYVCDPVLGDEGRLYVAREMVEAYAATIVPLASVLVPNQFEAEQLTGGKPIDSLAAAARACDELHARGPHTVVITSMTLPPTGPSGPAPEAGPSQAQAQGEAQAQAQGSGEYITLLASTTLPQRGGGGGGGTTRLVMRIERIRAYFTGTGDLFAALLLAWMQHHPGDLATAVDKAVGGLQAVLADTVRHCGPAALAAERTAEVCALRELRLIQCQGKLQDPPLRYRCEPLEL